MKNLIEFFLGLILGLSLTLTAYATDYSTITITESEYPELIRVIAGESQNDTFEAQIAVVETIFNRCLDSRFPDTPYTVISQKGQFSVWKIRYASWIEPSYGDTALSHVLTQNQSTILNDTAYVLFSTKPQKYGYDYIKIGKTYFGKLK